MVWKKDFKRKKDKGVGGGGGSTIQWQKSENTDLRQLLVSVAETQVTK